MSHHGPNPFPDPENDPRKRYQNTFSKLLNTASFRGATGQFPNGQLNKSDEGGIQMAIGEHQGKVVIEFGTPVAWVGMSAQEAADFASLLLKRATDVAARNGQVIDFVIR